MHFSPLAPLASPALKKAANGYIATMMWGLDQFKHCFEKCPFIFPSMGWGKGDFCTYRKKEK